MRPATKDYLFMLLPLLAVTLSSLLVGAFLSPTGFAAADVCTVPESPILIQDSAVFAPGTKQVMLKWQPVAGAASYDVRADTENQTISSGHTNDCGIHYLCKNSLNDTSITVSVENGKTYEWWVHAKSSCGTSAPAQRSFSIQPTGANNPPTAFVVGPNSGIGNIAVKLGTPVNITATASDVDADLAKLEVWVSPAEKQEWKLINYCAATGAVDMMPCTVTWTPLSQGLFDIVVNAYDNQGNKCSGNPWCAANTGCAGWADCGPQDIVYVSVGAGTAPQKTCQNKCGSQGTSGCWCDSSCTSYGDCCPDYAAMCGATPTTSLPTSQATIAQTCTGKCGSQGTSGCWCDNACTNYGDCCPDYSSVCKGSAPNP